MSTPTPLPPAGWYPDPAQPAVNLRYFDGYQWTGQVALRQGSPPPAGQGEGFGASPSDPVHWLLPTGRSGWSIAAGYVALFALLIWPLGPVALLLGFKGLRVAERDGSHGRGRAIFAIVVGALSTIALGVLLINLH
jgi:hypothetical protein